jgi:UPF0716 protein FxsA
VFVAILLLVLWPIVEIAVFLQVVQWIGVLQALGLLVLVSLGGAWIVKRQGVGTLGRMRAELDAGRVPTAAMVDGGLLMAAGLLLLIPGFLTDAVGLLLLLPPVRAGVRVVLGRRVAFRGARARRFRAQDWSDDRARGDDRPRWDPPELEP